LKVRIMKEAQNLEFSLASEALHHESLREIDAINEECVAGTSLFGIVNRFKAMRKLETRVNSRARYYGVVYDLQGNTHPAKAR